MIHAMKRRTLLRGLTAGLVSVPALSSLYGHDVRAHEESPRRLVIYWTPNGTVHNRFYPNDASDLTSKPILAPLAEHREDLVVLRATFSGNGDHKTGLPFSTTGRPYVISDDENSGISIDQEIANALGDATPQPSLTLAAQTKDNRRGYISANADGSRNPPIGEPWKAYEYMFGPYSEGGGSGPDIAELTAKQSVLDSVMDDLGTLRARVSGSERAKLEAHLEAVRQLEQNLGGTATDCAMGNTVQPRSSHDYPTRVRLHNELIAASLACDLTRVVSFMTAPAGHDNCNFGFLDLPVGGDIHQSIAHSSSGSTQDSGGSDAMALVGAWHAQGLADLISLLKAMPEGDGTVFDNTTILWATECAWGNHGHAGIPIVLAGTMGGKLKNGLYLPDELNSSTGYRSVLNTLAHAMGHELDTFGEGEACGVADALLA